MPGGRPKGPSSSPDNPVGTAADGSPVTAGERIISAVRAGNYIDAGAGMAGIPKLTVYNWLRAGARAGAKQLRGEAITSEEERLLWFTNSVDQAIADSEAEDVARLAMLARGGIKVVTVTEKVDGTGKIIEKTTKTDSTLPDKAVLMWRLERRFPRRWGRHDRLTVDVVPVVAEADRARELADDLRAFQEGVAAAKAVEAEREETEV